MRPFYYHRPKSLDEAITLLNDSGSVTRLLAGGTDLLTLMKQELHTPDRLVDIKRLPELDDRIAPTPEGGIRIGALETLDGIESNPLVSGTYPALAQAAAIAASPQLRNMATIGGNLLQRSRCWYYRHEHVQCWLNGGDECFARDGENQHHALFGDSPCVSAHSSDPASALLALDASVEITSASGNRTLPLAELFALPEDDRRRETTLADDEVITAIILPASGAETRSAYLKAMERKVWAFALVGVAARLTVESGTITDARLVLGGVAPIPWRVPEAEQALVGARASEATFANAAETALANARPLSKNAYKLSLLRALIPRALWAAAEQA
jgi:xanthine dehydrogenase YagS FAD-binding subunit